ncbi:MAG: bifunctional 4-hydroxy-3-methylbut-2-enyl diphosphate reductase/30S ribosomal protein S1 [Firmicutes bacterium]|nr:bifunctional 4-hydroxy-3-methylbut-2-enyl diphosphate reductase/30S ribosomal protein S1 [Bacillota bacterium]
MPEIRLAKTAGFCYGVRNAVEIAEKTAREAQKTVYTYGPLIHNQSVVEHLQEMGIYSVDSLDALSEGDTVIIRAHGVGRAAYEEMEARGLNVVDGTCPRVQMIHRIVEEQEQARQRILIFGDSAHPEVQGIAGWCKTPPLIVSEEAELDDLALDLEDPAALVAQTTFNQYKFLKMVEKLKNMGYNKIGVFSTICHATKKHQEEAVALAEQASVMVVIGGKHSSNTRKLYELCKGLCPETYLVEDAKDPAMQEVLASIQLHDGIIGVTAGASTPDYIMQEVLGTMSENKNFEEMLNETFREVHSRDIVKGTVVQVNEAEIVFDIGYKCDGTMTKDEFGGTDEPLEQQVHVGDVIDVMVVKVGDSEVTLSRRRLLQNKANAALQDSLDNKTVLKGVVTESFDNGIVVLYEGVKVFIPASLVDVRRVADLSTLIGQEVSFRIIRLQPRRRRVLGDRRSVIAEENAAKREETLKTLEIGARVKGTVKTLTNFCAFVDLGGIDGMLHISEMGWNVVRHPNQVLKEGQEIEVLIKDMNLEKNRISLSTRFPETNPWNGVEEEFAVGTVVEGKVVRFADFGAFVELKKGVDALIHISHISRKFVKAPGDVLKIGDIVQAKVIDLNTEQKRIALSLRELEPEEPAEFIEEVIDEADLDGAEIVEEVIEEAAPAVEEVVEEAAAEAAPVEE